MACSGREHHVRMPRSKNPEDTVQDIAIIDPRRASWFVGQSWLYHLPSKIGNVTSAHAALNELTRAPHSAKIMILNVIDRRTRPYRWTRINAIIEAVEHDNSCLDADQAAETPPLLVIDHDRRDDVSVQEAIIWAEQAKCPVTLYLYDADNGTTDMHFGFTEGRFPKSNGDPGV